jgi:DNA-binding LacI/PurR family transcriptional regulator
LPDPAAQPIVGNVPRTSATPTLSLVNDQEARVGEYLRSIGRPLVLIDREVRGIDADVVLTDSRGGVRDALQHLAALGHRTVGVANISTAVRPGREVAAGFAAAAEALGIECAAHIVVPYDRIDRRSGHEIADRMAEVGATAILSCVPTPVTAGVLERLGERGLTVPEDISVVGSDDSELAAVLRPGLTVIARHLDELSRAASRLVTSRLLNSQLPPRVEVVPMEVVVRGSTSPPARETRLVAR